MAVMILNAKKREEIALKALEDFKTGKTKPLTDINDYFSNL
jgi:hypothetical protein